MGLNGRLKSFNFDGNVKNYEPCFNGTEEACGKELFTGNFNLLIAVSKSFNYVFIRQVCKFGEEHILFRGTFLVCTGPDSCQRNNVAAFLAYSSLLLIFTYN
jgi:hypothetical protein